MFIVDAHLDLSMNAMEWNRDLRSDIDALRKRESGMIDKPDRGNATVSLPELRKGNVGLVVATQIARYVGPGNPLPGWHSPQQAWAQTQAQLAWYQAMEDEGEMVMIRDLAGLEKHLELWLNVAEGRGSEIGEGDFENHDGLRQPNPAFLPKGRSDRDTIAKASQANQPIGFILSLEGADSLVTIEHLEKAWQYGLRAVGPAHYGPGRYANGTDSSRRMNANGIELLKKMEQLNIILDATHLCDDAFWQALEHFNGPVWASHNNCRAVVRHNRQFSDDMIRALAERGAVIGAALDAWMIVPGWERGVSTPAGKQCNLEKVVDHIDHICQLTGNALHVGIGSDLDGAFGNEQCPHDLETIADLQKIPEIFKARGYSNPDIENLMHGNWLRFLRHAWQ